MAKVFLSYSATDAPLASEVNRALADCGFDVALNQPIRPGDSMAEAISEALRAADAFVIVLTPASSRSQWALLELGAAIASGKPVIPVLAEAGADIPLILRDRQYLDASEPARRTEALHKLCEILHDAMTRVATPDLRGGIELLERAQSSLDLERATYAAAVHQHLRAERWLVSVWTLLGVIATLVALGTSSTGATGVATSIATGLVTVTAILYAARLLVHWRSGYFRSRHPRDRS